METLFNHILVPVDFTAKNEVAIAAAQELARQNAARISLLHVIEFIDFPDDDEISSFYERLQRRSEQELDILLKLFKDDSLDVSVETTINNRAKGIALYAAENDVDLIVMSSHPVSPEKRGHGWTTISYQVSAICQCSILLVKQPSD
jgi:nucleotide-binding universal stress UspA family protein